MRTTTGIVRTLGALKNAGLLKRARGMLIRRATDPWESDHTGVMNTVVPEKVIPSHQGADAQTIIPDLDVITIAVVAAHTNQAIVVPETIDAMRVLTGIEHDAATSIAKTDEALGMMQEFVKVHN